MIGIERNVFVITEPLTPSVARAVTSGEVGRGYNGELLDAGFVRSIEASVPIVTAHAVARVMGDRPAIKNWGRLEDHLEEKHRFTKRHLNCGCVLQNHFKVKWSPSNPGPEPNGWWDVKSRVGFTPESFDEAVANSEVPLDESSLRVFAAFLKQIKA